MFLLKLNIIIVINLFNNVSGFLLVCNNINLQCSYSFVIISSCTGIFCNHYFFYSSCLMVHAMNSLIMKVEIPDLIPGLCLDWKRFPEENIFRSSLRAICF